MGIRKQISEVLEEISRLNPTMRFGQLVANISFLARGPVTSAVWDVEDEELLRAAQEHPAQLQARRLEQVTA